MPASSYVATAVGRAATIAHVRPETVIEVVGHAWRYYYLGQAGLALLVCAMIAQVLRHRRLVAAGTVVLATWLVFVVASRVFWPPSFERFQIWHDKVRFFRGMIEGEIRKVAPGLVACVPNQAVEVCIGFPGSIGVYMLHHGDDAFEGRRVYFTSSDPKVLALRHPGLPDGGAAAARRAMPARTWRRRSAAALTGIAARVQRARPSCICCACG